MNGIIRWATERPKTVIAAYVVVTALALMGTTRLHNEEDLLVFLPTSDPDVQLFQSVSKKFGALRVALIGVDAPAGQDVFAPRIMTEIAEATEAIKNVRGVDRVVSLTTLSDVVSGPLGAEVTQLVARPPQSEAERNALRDKVLSRAHVVGNFVSKDGRAALIMVFLAEGGELHVEDAIKKAALGKLDGVKVYFGGAPFAAQAIYQEAQGDVWHLSPVALLVLLLVVVLAFRDPVGVALTVLSVAFSAVVILGGMGWVGDKFTVATSTLPVILFASGSSYAVHVLGRYYMLRSDHGPKESIQKSLGIVGPPLAIAAGTTAVGFYSFVTTDVRPMRAFGIACGSGVLLCWLTSLTLVPAVVALFPRRAHEHLSLETLGDWLVATWHWAQRNRKKMIVAAMLLGALTVGPMLKVRVRMEPRAFFRVGSEPWLAEQFLDERFGGATFLQVAVHGDLDDPATLRQIARLCDFARAQPGVTQVSAVTGPLMLVDDVMGAGLRLPSTRAQAANLYFFLQGEAGMRELITDDRHDALVHIRLRGNAGALVTALENFVQTLPREPAHPTVNDVAERIAWIAQAHGKQASAAELLRALQPLKEPADDDPEWQARERKTIDAYLSSDEAPQMTDADRAELSRLLAAHDWHDARLRFHALAGSPEEGGLAFHNLMQNISDEQRHLAVARATPVALHAANLATDDPQLTRDVAAVVDDLFAHLPASERAEVPLSASIAGEPILDRGFSRSVGDNQVRSLVVTIIAVLILMCVLFRSITLALLSMAPSLLTMAIIFGVMGMLDVPIDLGTSLVAGIATGAGSDFAMHYLWYLRRQSPDEVSRSVGPVMVVSIILVSLGFWVLALGKSPVMHLFGTLAGLSMSLSALLTCLLVPAVLNKVKP